MSSKDIVTLGDLAGGPYLLDAAEFKDDYGSATAFSFRLNGIVYTVIEDEDDGYRSFVREITSSTSTPMKNTFKPVLVAATYIDNGYCEILNLVDLKSGKVVLEVGTENTDDYYPYFVCRFSPEALCLNATIEAE